MKKYRRSGDKARCIHNFSPSWRWMASIPIQLPYYQL